MLVRRIVMLWLVLTACALPPCVFASPAGDLAANGALVIFFGPASAGSERGLLSDGSLYIKERGFGWDQDLTAQTRDRGDGCTGVALLETGISQAVFTIDLPDGDYLFEVTVGDTGYSGGLAVDVDGNRVADPLTYLAGKSASIIVPVTSRNGKAAVTFEGGRNGVRNGLIRSITITPSSADPAKWNAAKEAAGAYLERAKQLRADRAALLVRRRAEYRALSLRDEHAPRQTIDLSGKWLFCPVSESGNAPQTARYSDKDWHVMHVPDFWKPIEWWIYMQGSGTSHDFYRNEVDRCEAFTFDYKTTNAGWYRQWIEVPASMRGRRLVLRFDAVASIAQVYWNGKSVGSHVGMFGPFECEVTQNVKFGEKNLLAVFVSAGKVDPAMAKRSLGVAVTVNITQEMLNSLAHGCYKAGMPGIWQPVSLVVSGKDRIADVFFKPRMDGAKIETAVSSSSKQPLIVRSTIVDAVSGKTLYSDTKGSPAIRGRAVTDTGKLQPRLWSPEHPNLYVLKTKLLAGGKIVDEVSTTVGFKTFEARGNRLYLNGKPYFLRGADQPPHGIKPNNKPLADKFMKMMHDGNTMATRFHVAPPSRIWLDAADKYGVGSSVGEDWPWVLMGSTPIPDKKLIELWRQEFLDIVRANRNHPSMLMWTISNESYFEGDTDLKRREEKYRIFSDLIKDVRKEDPTIPIVFHSGHVRAPGELPMLAANKFDDGDVDDSHFYIGWYWKSPFMLSVAKDIETKGMGKRPLISQEASTGYPDNDTGHPVESYITQHGVPQAWVGSHALYSDRPDEFLETHGVITKEYAERIRRERSTLSGWMIFSNTCWFKDVYDAETISPYPVYWAVRKAWQPVLVSLESSNRHFTAGQKFSSEVWVSNDDPDRPTLRNLSLVWHVRDQSNGETSGRASLPDCAYDKRSHGQVEFRIPDKLAMDRANVKLDIELWSGEEVVSRNDYDLICAEDQFYSASRGSVLVLENDTKTSDYLTSAGIKCDSRRALDWKSLDRSAVVVIAAGVDKATLGSARDFADFVKGGGKVLAINAHGADSVMAMIPDLAADKVTSVDASGDFVEPLVPELLDGLDAMDMHWWNAEPEDTVRVCRFAYRVVEGDGVSLLAQHIQPHGYLNNGRKLSDYTSWPAFEVRRGSGKVIVSSFILADDPIARRFWGNLVSYVGK